MYKEILEQNGWEQVDYNGRMRNAPQGMGHIFRDLQAGIYFVAPDRTILCYLNGVPARFEKLKYDADYKQVLHLAIADFAVRLGYVFVEKEPTNIVVYPTGAALPTDVLYELSTTSIPNKSVFAYNLRSKEFYADAGRGGANSVLFYDITQLLDSMCMLTPYRAVDDVHPMTRQEAQRLIQDLRKMLDLLEYNVIQGSGLW